MPKTSARRSAFVLALPIFLIIFSTGCERNPSAHGPTPPARSESAFTATASPAVDRELDDRFAFAAGLPAGSPAFAAWQEEPAWKDFSKTAGEMCGEFNSAVLGPMRAWAAVDLGAAREKTSTLFYPFGGPDFATAFALFPQASKTILLGLEPVGNLTDFDRLSPEGRASFFADMGALAFDFLTRGYFVTMRMLESYSRGNVDGALPVIGFFLKRGGYSVVDVRRLAPDEKGGWTETPYERLASRPHRPYGVRIDYVKPGDSVLRSVYYFSCDVENKAFREDSSLHKFCEGLERMTTFVKAGSYLLHWDNFSILRRLILDGSLFVLEDDTAVPYRFFKSGGWEVTLFGRYATPVKDFTNVEQPDLRQAYEDPEGKVKPLPFHFGYRWRTQVDNLLLAERPRRPYKVPVVR